MGGFMRAVIGAQHKQRRRHPRCLHGAESGFTLIELMVSAAIFSIGMSGIIAMHIGIMQNNSLANDISLASNLSMSGLERLKVTDFNLVVGSSTCPPIDPLVDMDCYFNKGGQLVPEDEAYFTRTWVAQYDPVMQVTDVTVTIDWQFSIAGGYTKAPRRVEMTGRLFPR